MRSIHTVLGTAVLGASLALTVPAAHAATPQATTKACAKAVAAADKAEAAYSAAVADFKKQVAGGGHPGTAEQDNVTALLSASNAAASLAARVCPDAKVPSGAMRTGAGSTSQGVDTADLAAGAGLIAAVGLGAVALRRRRSETRA
jgi:hypothetical protein